MRFNPITTALVMWLFGFICGALGVWVRHWRAMARLDDFIKPVVFSRPDWQEDYPYPSEDVDTIQFNQSSINNGFYPNPNKDKTDKELQDIVSNIIHETEDKLKLSERR